MADSYRTLVVWQKAMSFTTDLYRTTTFPKEEVYGLTSQLRRAAVSVPSNIAEGKGRLSKREYLQFLSRARGSLCEVDTQLEIAANLGYLSVPAFESLAGQSSEIGRVLNGLIAALKRQIEGFPES